jgi:hypothetical protein
MPYSRKRNKFVKKGKSQKGGKKTQRRWNNTPFGIYDLLMIFS